MPLLGGSHWDTAMPFGTEKLEWLGYPTVKKLFIRFDRMYEHDRQTDTHRDTQTDTT